MKEMEYAIKEMKQQEVLNAQCTELYEAHLKDERFGEEKQDE